MWILLDLRCVLALSFLKVVSGGVPIRLNATLALDPLAPAFLVCTPVSLKQPHGGFYSLTSAMPRPKRSCVRPVPQISYLEDDDEGVAVSPAGAAASSQQHSEPASSSDMQTCAFAEADSGSEYEDEEESEDASSAAVPKPKRHVSIWVPQSRSDRCYFSELPLEILDLILSYHTLTLRDHCVMAGVNRTLREAYSNEDLWYKLERSI